MNRRQFVAVTAASMSTAASGAVEAFDLGVASGDPQVNGVLLWTRINPAAYVGGATEWFIASDPGMANAVASGAATVDPASDYAVKVNVQNAALRPFTTYYYQFRYNGNSSRVGRFKTLPAANAALSRLRLGFLSCQDYTNGFYTAMAAMAEENLDYIVHLGDYIYESVGDPDFQGAQVRPIGLLPSGGTVAANLEDYRFLYRKYRSDLNLQRLHESFAMIATWDDHEFANDSWQDYHPDNTPTPELPDPALRAAANQAWVEYMPAAVNLASLQLYRPFVFGRLAELLVTDERLYRDGPPCGLEDADRSLTKACPAVDDPGRSMLGAGQKQWFVSRLLNSEAVWKVWANEMMCMPLKAKNDKAGNEDIYVTLDAWDGYRSERRALLTAVGGVKNLVAVTGDIHSFGAGYLQADYESEPQPRVGVEFVGGSITSSNLSEILESPVELVSAPLAKARIAATPIGLLAKIINPHLEFFNSSAHGYGILELTPLAAKCTLRRVSSITSEVGVVSDLASFLVPRDRVEIRRIG